MRIKKEIIESVKIEFGDIVVDIFGDAYIVAKNIDKHFKVVFIKMSTGERDNGWMDLDIINEQMLVRQTVPIVRVIKNKHIVISEEKCTE